MKKYTIFSTDTMQYSAEDVRECLMANDVAESAITDDMIADIRFRWMSDDYDDLIAQIETCDEFPCYTKANLGLWYGRRQAYAQDKDLKSAIMRCLAGRLRNRGDTIRETHDHRISSRRHELLRNLQGNGRI